MWKSAGQDYRSEIVDCILAKETWASRRGKGPSVLKWGIGLRGFSFPSAYPSWLDLATAGFGQLEAAYSFMGVLINLLCEAEWDLVGWGSGLLRLCME